MRLELSSPACFRIQGEGSTSMTDERTDKGTDKQTKEILASNFGLLANLNYGKTYIFISNTFSLLKFTFFALTSGKMLLAVPTNGQF